MVPYFTSSETVYLNIKKECPVLSSDKVNEEAFLQQVMTPSQAGEEAQYPELLYTIELAYMVAEHITSLPHLPSLSAYTSSQARYGGK
jgi:hypothetical protein